MDEGFISKNGDDIRSFMFKDFTDYRGHSGLTKPQEYDYDLDVVLMDEGHACKRFDIVSVTERANGKKWILFGSKTNTMHGQAFPAQRLFI